MKGKIVINRELCKGCGFCVTVCPQGLIGLEEGLNAKSYHPAITVDNGSCNACSLCAVICPDLAIEVWRENSGKRSKKKTGSKNK
jgi:2-oxoglutarate ferredoxin oxidoreductase subunit delta